MSGNLGGPGAFSFGDGKDTDHLNAIDNQIVNFITSNLSTAISTIEVRSTFSPPVLIDVAKATAPKPPSTGGGKKLPSPVDLLLGRVQPTIILSGNIGRQAIAPYGEANPDAWKINGTALAVVVFSAEFLLLAIAYKLGQRKGRRS